MNFKDLLWKGKCALPDHLKEKLHNDWIWPLNSIPRAFSAKGPRCPKDSQSYLLWPPRLVEGYDITRWEWCDDKGNRKEIYIPAFEDKEINSDIYKIAWTARNEEGEVVAIDLKSENYWPSIIPTTSEHGWLKLDPEFYCEWRTRPSWKKYYFRYGNRPDFDYYYNTMPYVGRNPE